MNASAATAPNRGLPVTYMTTIDRTVRTTESVFRAASPVLRLTIRTSPSVTNAIRMPGLPSTRATSRPQPRLMNAAALSSGSSSRARAQDTNSTSRKSMACCSASNKSA